MPRPSRKKVEFTAEALRDILQSIFSEAEETNVKATLQYNKQNKDVHDNQDIALVSKINSEYLKIRNDTTEKKLSVARLMKDVIYKDSVNSTQPNGVQTSDAVLSNDDKKAIFNLIKGDVDKKNIELTLSDDKVESEPF